jgi:hypothetical protein
MPSPVTLSEANDLLRRSLLATLLGTTPVALAESPNLIGGTGLLATPSAEVQEEGSARFSAARFDQRGATPADVESYDFSVGFLPGLEMSGRVVEVPAALRDLSLNAKYGISLPGGLRIAAGAQDIGGEAQNFRTVYGVATLPWRTLSFSAGYGSGPDVLEGAFGGIEWRPWPFVGVVAEHDAEDFNGGLKLESPPLLWGARLGAVAAYRGVSEEIEYGAHLKVPLGRREPAVVAREAPQGSGDNEILRSSEDESVVRDTVAGPSPAPAADAGRSEDSAPLRAALTRLGFESLRIGRRAPATLVVGLENRTYNHSSVDGIGLALGVIASLADPAIERIELTLFTYDVPQLAVAVPAALYRDFLADPAAHADALRAALAAGPVAGFAHDDGITWDAARYAPLNGAELVAEPVLRSFVATEYGLIDYALGARLRLTAPLSRGFLVHLGGQLPLVRSDDFEPGENFHATGVEAGLDLALAQFAHKMGPQTTWLWSAGRSQVYRVDLNTVALEQLWSSLDGRHRLRSKLMSQHFSGGARNVALAGYTWFDPERDYEVALTGGRFYSGDSGVRLELNRWFGDTLCGLFFKAASRDDQAIGLQITLPLTPRRDAAPRALQLKGSRRWGHGVASTLNASDERNPLRPLLLHEPMLDLDLRRDFSDSGRLGEAYLRDELPRLREAYELWGR